MKSRKNRNEDHVDSHRWIVSYADFITILFAFFVVMYAISSVNDSKYKSLSEGMHSAFNKKDQNKATVSTAKLKDGPEVRQTKGTYKDGMDELNKSLSVLQDGNYKINRQEGWIELEIKAGSLFGTGTAELKPDALIKLMNLAGRLKGLAYPVAIEGYTDNVPIQTPQFPSNWELSALRAATVGRLLNSYGIASERITVTGYADQYPITDNFTEGARSQNRRVNIVIAKDRNIPRILNPDLSQMHHAIIGDMKPIESKKQDPVKKELK